MKTPVHKLEGRYVTYGRPRQGTWIEPEARWNLLDPDVLRWLLERQPAMKLLIEFTQVRLGIEPMAASIAARAWTRSTLAPIEVAIERMYAAQEGAADALDSDSAFHVAVLRASENQARLVRTSRKRN